MRQTWTNVFLHKADEERRKAEVAAEAAALDPAEKKRRVWISYLAQSKLD